MVARAAGAYHALVAWLRTLADLFVPPVCRVCRRPGDFPLCRGCLAEFRLISPPRCVTCGRPVRRAAPPTVCAACRISPPLYTRARPAGVYDGALREAIHALKFGGCRAIAGPLGDLIAATVQADDRLRADVIIPVPLHASRYRQRGFNQAELLARRVAMRLGLPCEARLLRRARATEAQSGLNREVRETNVRGAFVCARPLAGHDVLLVDDVMSTGFTVSECARALGSAGAREVAVATAAAAVLA